MPSKVAIFWDYGMASDCQQTASRCPYLSRFRTENCHPPSGSSGSKLVDNIRRLAQAHGHIRVFKAYADLSLDLPEQHSPGLLYELQSSGVTLVHCPHNGMKEAADKMMIGASVTLYVSQWPVGTDIRCSGHACLCVRQPCVRDDGHYHER